MFTEVLIPMEPAPADPTWMIKRHSGKKLDPLELEEYYEYIFQKDHQALITDRNWRGMPSFNTLGDIIQKYHYIKKHCL
jgi:hypothetical protein